MAGHGGGQDKGGGGSRGKELAAASYSSAQNYTPYLAVQTLQILGSDGFYAILDARVENLLDRIPRIDGVPIDLHRIFVEVASRGGIYQVIKNGQLQEVCSILSQRISPAYLHEVYMSLLHSLEYDFGISPNHTSTELQRGSSARPAPQPRFTARTNQVQGMAQPGLPPFDAQVVATQQREPNASSVPQSGFSAHPSPAQYHAGMPQNFTSTARPSSSAQSFHNQRLILPNPPPLGSQVIATQESEGMSQYSTAMHWNSTATAPQPGSSAHPSPAQYYAGMPQRFTSTARPSSSAQSFHNQRLILPNPPQPGSQVIATQQSEGMSQYSTAMHWNSTAPQPGSSARLIPAQGEAGREVLSPETQVIQYFPSTAPQPSSSATPQAITEPKLTFPGAQVAAKRQRTATGSLPGVLPNSSASWVPNQGVVQPDLPPLRAVEAQTKEGNFLDPQWPLYIGPDLDQYLEGIRAYSASTAPQSTSSPKMEQTQYHKAYAPLPSSSPRQFPVQREDGTELLSPEAQIVAIQQEEGNYFVAPEWITHVRPVSAQYLEGSRPYSPSTAPQSTSYAKMEQSLYHKDYAPQPSSSAMPLAISEAQGAAKRQRTPTCSSPDKLTSLINRPMEDPPLNISQSWLETVESTTITDHLLQSAPSANDFSSIEHWQIDKYEGTPTETQKAVDKLELMLYGDKTEDTSGKQDAKGEKNEDTEVSTELSLGRHSEAE